MRTNLIRHEGGDRYTYFSKNLFGESAKTTQRTMTEKKNIPEGIIGLGKRRPENREKLQRALEWAREQRELNSVAVGRFMKRQAEKAREFSV